MSLPHTKAKLLDGRKGLIVGTRPIIPEFDGLPEKGSVKPWAPDDRSAVGMAD